MARSAADAVQHLDDIEPAPLPDDRTLRRIANLATRQAQLEEWIAASTAYVNYMGEELKTIRERELPEAMAMAGLDSFTLAGGRKVSVRTVYSAGIRTEWPAEHRERGFAYLEKNGAGTLIRHDVTVSFGRGDSKAARSLLGYVRKQGWLKRFVINDKTWVHAGQLAAWVRERLEGDLPVEMETLDAKEMRISRVETSPREVL